MSVARKKQRLIEQAVGTSSVSGVAAPEAPAGDHPFRKGSIVR